MNRPLPLAVYYEHPEWFRPLFAELDSAFDRLRPHRCAVPRLRSGGNGPKILFVFQSHERVGIPARQCAEHFLHARLSDASGTHRHARDQREQGILD